MRSFIAGLGAAAIVSFTHTPVSVAQDLGEPLHIFRDSPSPTSGETRDRLTKVYKYPEVNYPIIANFFRVPGYCVVELEVQDGDRLIVNQVRCNRREFCTSAKEGAKAAIIHVEYDDGRPASRKSIMWPILYSIPGVADPDQDEDALGYCNEGVVS